MKINIDIFEKCGKIKLIRTAFFLIEKGKKVKYMYKYRGGIRTYGTSGADYYK